jgi:hypothetical protein
MFKSTNNNNLLRLLLLSIFVCISILVLYYIMIYIRNHFKLYNINENFENYDGIEKFNPGKDTGGIPMDKLSEFVIKAHNHENYNIDETDKGTGTVYLFYTMQHVKTFRIYPTEYNNYPSFRIALLTRDIYNNYIPVGIDKESSREVNSYHQAQPLNLSEEQSYLDRQEGWSPSVPEIGNMYLQINLKNREDIYGFIIKPRGSGNRRPGGREHIGVYSNQDQYIKKFVCFKSWRHTLNSMDFLSSNFIRKVDNIAISITECLNCGVKSHEWNKDFEYDVKFKIEKKDKILREMSNLVEKSDYKNEYDTCIYDYRSLVNESTKDLENKDRIIEEKMKELKICNDNKARICKDSVLADTPFCVI